MTLPQAPRRGEDCARPQHFSYLKVEKGDKLFGYLAGPVMWFEMHTSDYGSKPCLEALTGGELTCAKCKYGPPIQKGACGFYHGVDHKPYMVWLDEGQRDFYDTLPVFGRVAIGREKVKGAPVWVMRCLSQEPPFTTTLPERRVPADLTVSLLRMWAMPELVMWYNQTHGQSDSPLTLKTKNKPVRPRAAKPGDMVAGAHRLIDDAVADTSGVDEATQRIKDRAGGKRPPPGTNGKY